MQTTPNAAALAQAGADSACAGQWEMAIGANSTALQLSVAAADPAGGRSAMCRFTKL